MPPDAAILAFDTSAAHCAAALVSGGHVLAARQEPMDKGQAERLFPLLEELLAEAGLGWRDLGALAVGIGPGNFTGVRIAVSAARGLALALNLPAHGVSSLQASAFGLPGPVLASLDARQGRVYLQCFGTEEGPPLLAELDRLPAGLGARGLTVTGHAADRIAAELGGTVAKAAHALAPAIALIAAARPAPAGRPAPLYLRPADALPPRDRAPAILP